MVIITRGVKGGVLVGCRAFTIAVTDDVEVGVFEEAAFVDVTQAIVADVLERTCRRLVAEGTDEVLQSRHTTPDGGVNILHDFGCGQTVFVELASVAEDVFRNVTEVDVKFSGVVLEFLFGEGVHEPEL